MLQFLVFLYWVAFYYIQQLYFSPKIVFGALCSLTPPKEHFQYLRHKSVNVVHSGIRRPNCLNSFHLWIYQIQLNCLCDFVVIMWSQSIFPAFWVMLTRQRWSVVTGLAVKHCGTKPSLCLVVMKVGWSITMTSGNGTLQRWRQGCALNVLCKSSQKNALSMMGGEAVWDWTLPPLFFCCYIMNMHMVESVCLFCVCWCVCGWMWA